MPKLLFICSRNKRRSLTAERLMEGVSGYQARSAGTQPGARIVVTPGHIGWADLIFCDGEIAPAPVAGKIRGGVARETDRDAAHPRLLRYLQPELLDEFRTKLGPYVTLPE